MENFEDIEDYFKGVTIAGQESAFEHRLLTDKEFAEQVAFYLNTIQVARTSNYEDKKIRFKELYVQNSSAPSSGTRKQSWSYAVLMAAVLTALIIGLYLYQQPERPPQLADTYINNNLQALGVQMGNNDDLLQQGKNLYNQGKYAEALQKFETLIQSDSLNADVNENAGIVALKAQQYEKAVRYFNLVAKDEGLTENPGKFYLALTLMKRNAPGDKARYIRLLNEVEQENLFGKGVASDFLKKFN